MVSLLNRALYVLAQEHIDPVQFLQNRRNVSHRLWWSPWLVRASAAFVVLVIFVFVAGQNEQHWAQMMAYALLLALMMQIVCAFAISILGEPEFWLLYAWSPLTWAIALFCGLAPLSSLWMALGWRIGFPLLIGLAISDMCTLGVHIQVEKKQRDHQRTRQGGVASDLPAWRLWLGARCIRLAAAMVQSLLFLFMFQDPISALAGVVGCLRLDATLLAWIPGQQVVRRTPDQKGVRATCIGRSAMFIPTKLLHPVLTQNPAEQSRMLLILAHQGYLAPALRHAIKRLSSDKIQQLGLYLSIQEGGAAVMGYFKPALPKSFHPMLDCYQSLAVEAAKPPDLQRWLATLTHASCLDLDIGSDSKGSPLRTLQRVRETLLVGTYAAEPLNAAIADLQSFVQSLDGAPLTFDQEVRPLSWPAALLLYLIRHRDRVLAG